MAVPAMVELTRETLAWPPRVGAVDSMVPSVVEKLTIVLSATRAPSPSRTSAVIVVEVTPSASTVTGLADSRITSAC